MLISTIGDAISKQTSSYIIGGMFYGGQVGRNFPYYKSMYS